MYMHEQSCCFTSINLLLFWRCRRRRCILRSLMYQRRKSEESVDIFPDEGSIAETSEFYLQLSAFNLPPSHF